MSGIVRSIKKVFKRAAKVARKVLPVALAVAAIVYTGGAAMGATWAAGGWGAAASAMTSKLGATGVLADILATSITHAGYGAAIGALGGREGMEKGAMTGALTGAAAGGLGMTGDAIGEAATKFGTPSPAAATLPGVPGQAPVGPGALQPAAGDATTISQAAGGAPIQQVSTGASAPVTDVLAQGGSQAPAETGGLWSSIKDSEFAGSLVSAGGKALMSMGDDSSEEAVAATKAKMAEDERAATAANYGDQDRGLLTPENLAYMKAKGMRPTPAQRYDPRTYNGQWVYDPSQGKLVFVPNTATG